MFESKEHTAGNKPSALHQIGSILLASADPPALRAWYERAFDVHPDPDGFLPFGTVDLLIVARDNVAPLNREPGRVIINIHVDDVHATALHLSAIGVRWLAELEYRLPYGAWFGTLIDPDGNYVQIIELTAAYWAARRLRHKQAWPECARGCECGNSSACAGS